MNMEEFEEAVLRNISEEDRKIYKKWKNMELLVGDNAFIDVFLSKTYENFK